VRSVLNDLKQSLRIFLRNPVFTLAALSALALGIGANTAVFSVVNAVLLKPARFRDPARTVWLATTVPSGNVYLSSDPMFTLWQQQTSIFEDVTGQEYAKVNLTGVDSPEEVQIARVTSSYFRLLGLPIAQGRGFTVDEDGPNGRRVAVLSDGCWKRRFGGDPGMIGKNITLNGRSYEVVGIAASGAQTEAPAPPEIWIPLPIDPNNSSQVEYFLTMARLRPGVTLSLAREQLKIAAEEYRRKFPNTITMRPGYSFGADLAEEAMVKNTRPSLLILWGAVSLVLLIACANVANLLLFRAAGRTREIAIRLAIGASRTRIVRQLLIESATLSLIGGVCGLLVTSVGLRGLLRLNPAIPRIGEYGDRISIDSHVLAFTLLVALLTGLLFGLIPALQSSRTDPSAGLGDGRSSAGLRQSRIRSVLVVGEISLALVLMIGAALLIRSYVILQSVNPGFDAHNALTLHMSLASSRFETTSQVNQFVRDATRRLDNLPAVISSGAASWLPFETGATLPFIVVGRPLTGPSHGFGHWRNVSPAYFDALKIPLLRGRLFTDRDGEKNAGVVIINQAMAREYWPGKDPLADQIDIAPNVGKEFDEPPRQIIGIVGDVLEDALDQRPLATMYIPMAQISDARISRLRQTIVWIIRTRAQPDALIPAVSKELKQASGGLPVGGFGSISQSLAQSTGRQEFNTELLSIFGGAALLLAAIGIYGVIAYSVQLRTHEIGIRIALGAGTHRVLKMVLVQGVRLAVIGIALGLGAAFALTRFLARFLFGVHTHDPAVFVSTPLVLLGVAFAAAWFPAHRAARLSPLDALRHE
jgi:putative ABC transport system permease protein